MTENIEQMKKQLNEFWQGLEKGKKVKISISAILILLSLTSVIYLTTRTEYDVLYSNLSLKDAGMITQKLDEMGVAWKNGNNESTILVPKDMINRIKIELATEGLPKEGYSFIDAFNDSTWTMTDYEKRERLNYALQSELASTISEIDGIENATVYIDIPEESVFVLNEQEKQPKASVFLKLRRGMPLASDKVAAIRNLVAGAVKGLNVENVTITDDSGRLLTNSSSFEEFNLSEQMSIQQTLQLKLNDSIKRFLENVYGYGNVDVRSNVKVNFDTEITNIVQFSPPIEGNDEGLVRSMEELEEHTINGIDGGVPGVDSNTNDTTDYVRAEEGTSKYDRASQIINYELNELNQQIRKAPGQIESVTVAILINQDALIDGELTEDDKREIQDLIYAATGLDTKTVSVQAARFNKSANENLANIADLSEEGKWNMPIWVVAFIIIASVGIISFVLYKNKKNKYDINEVLKEVSAESQPVEEIDFNKGQSEIMEQVNRFIEKKPDQVAQLLRTWLNED